MLVAEGGREALTLDAVALRAGVSRSGLLYHFAVKEELLTATAVAIVTKLAQATAAEAARLPDGPTRRLKSYVLSSTLNRAGNDRFVAKALAAGPIPTGTIDPIRQYWKDRFAPLAADVGFDRAALVHVATEGLWFMEVLALSPFGAEQRRELVAAILALVDGAAIAPLASARRSGPAD
jgi:AcrR family transcriptional regulator